jgi:hypothetical protein
MDKDKLSSYDSNDLATAIISAAKLANSPIGVRDLDELPDLLKATAYEVKLAAARVKPWTSYEGLTFWSVRQIARAIALRRARLAA